MGLRHLKSGQGISLRRWFYLNARIPFLVSVLALIVVETSLLAFIAKNQWKAQQGVAERLGQLSLLAIQQKSTPLLQTGFDIAVKELRAVRAFVCEKSKMYVVSPPQPIDCVIDEKWGYRVIRVPLSSSYCFVLQVPLFPKDDLIYFTLLVSLGVSGMAFLFLRRMRNRLEKDILLPLFESLTQSIQLPIHELESLRIKMSQLSQLKTQQAVTAAVLARNQQVAHDIKSPLTALLFASKDFDLLPGESRGVIQSAVQRIVAIADSLLEKREIKSKAGESGTLKGVMREIFQEKQSEFKRVPGLQWIFNVEQLPEHTRAALPSEDLKRVLSNLVNNSVEAMEGLSGVIEVGAQSDGGETRIWVKDEGRGVPGDWVSKLGQRGLSIGKTGGHGLGLSHAKETVEQVGGNLSLELNPEKGVTVQLRF